MTQRNELLDAALAAVLIKAAELITSITWTDVQQSNFLEVINEVADKIIGLKEADDNIPF